MLVILKYSSTFKLEDLVIIRYKISELVNLNRDDINFENKSCLVFGKGKKMRKVYFDGKTKLHTEEYFKQVLSKI